MCFKNLQKSLKSAQREEMQNYLYDQTKYSANIQLTSQQWISWCLSAEGQEGKLRNHRGKFWVLSKRSII